MTEDLTKEELQERVDEARKVLEFLMLKGKESGLSPKEVLYQMLKKEKE